MTNFSTGVLLKFNNAHVHKNDEVKFRIHVMGRRFVLNV